MILIDFQQVVISNLMMLTNSGPTAGIAVDENLVRHMVLNSFRSYRSKFVREYGEIVICCDDKNYWRKDIFPYYKASRRKIREDSKIDWNQIFHCIHTMEDELRTFFPYKVLRVERAEADDIIASICHRHGTLLNASDTEKILILSADKDFIQLQKYANVTQYDPIRKRWIKHDNPELYLKEHILRGDTGDGVPNVLSDDDTFVSGKRQKPMTKKRIDQLINNDAENETIKRGIARNDMVINLFKIPDEIKELALNKYDETKENGRENLFNYFIKNRLKNLLESIGDF